MLKMLKRYFVTGILVVLPLVLSVYILFQFFNFADNILGKFINEYFRQRLGFYIPGLGLILTVLIILAAGIVATHLFKRRIRHSLDRFFGNLPLLKYIYPVLKQIFEFIFSRKDEAFKRTVLVEFPRKGIWSLGFSCADSFTQANQKTGKELENIYLPWAPNPFSGFTILVPKDEVIYLDISIKEAMKFIVTGGIMNPKNN